MAQFLFQIFFGKVKKSCFQKDSSFQEQISTKSEYGNIECIAEHGCKFFMLLWKFHKTLIHRQTVDEQLCFGLSAVESGNFNTHTFI